MNSFGDGDRRRGHLSKDHMMTAIIGSFNFDAAMVVLMMLIITGLLMWATSDADI